MKKFLAALSAVAILATGVIVPSAPAAADGYYRDYGRHGHYRGHYRGGYRDHYRHRGYRHHGGGDALAAGAIGLGVGALIGSAIAADRPSYSDRGSYQILEGPVEYGRPAPVYRAPYDRTAACYARYRTYDASSNTFIGNDGRAHPCRL
ncbi:BA14K family protein [Aureimonas glaciei]|jgi:hypothetical protein|uniref:Lectin-like protein BA14k n=1 Tax=Aureimonas glaciei TaxID=1776957 RepID=A0A916XTH1_9HYPH|nr:BA14K family protein [Aureimonas glaciei]GGD06927.1 hypothetical protein GCM10011335_07410 [Aureimonas glaciei]